MNANFYYIEKLSNKYEGKYMYMLNRKSNNDPKHYYDIVNGKVIPTIVDKKIKFIIVLSRFSNLASFHLSIRNELSLSGLVKFIPKSDCFIIIGDEKKGFNTIVNIINKERNQEDHVCNYVSYEDYVRKMVLDLQDKHDKKGKYAKVRLSKNEDKTKEVVERERLLLLRKFGQL